MARVIRYFFTVIAIVALTSLVIEYVTRARTAPFKQNDGSILPGSIASLEVIRLGGLNQHLLIRGTDTANPVLLFLHGGPGMPMMYLAHSFQKPLEHHFIVVQWDQRGAGKSYDPDIPPESMNVEQFLSDAHELVLHLRERFGKEKIYLAGHSWGSMLGIILARRHPELFHAYIGIGQAVDNVEARKIQDQFIREKAIATGNESALRDVERGRSYDREKWLFEFGGKLKHETSWFPFLITGLFSPEYDLIDAWNIARGPSFSSIHMPYNAIEGSILKEVTSLAIPCYFFTDRLDYTTPSELTILFERRLEAPLKGLVWFEESAHFPFYEEPVRFAVEMTNVVRATSP